MSHINKKISKKEFFEALERADETPSRAAPGRADWETIYKELKKTKEPLDIKTIQEDYVKGAVVRYRTKNVLQEWAEQGRCLQIYDKGRYWYYFGRLPPGMRAKIEEMKKKREEGVSS